VRPLLYIVESTGNTHSVVRISTGQAVKTFWGKDLLGRAQADAARRNRNAGAA
jgi:hypothetical protein